MSSISDISFCKSVIALELATWGINFNVENEANFTEWVIK